MKAQMNMPNISESTLKEMAAFFMKTSIPRIVAAEKEKVKEAERK
jgi:hypothetical protein